MAFGAGKTPTPFDVGIEVRVDTGDELDSKFAVAAATLPLEFTENCGKQLTPTTAATKLTYRDLFISQSPVLSNVEPDDAFRSFLMTQKAPYVLGLDLNIDLASRTVTAVLAAESIDASRPARRFRS
jgi:hypothetical protein